MPLEVQGGRRLADSSERLVHPSANSRSDGFPVCGSCHGPLAALVQCVDFRLDGCRLDKLAHIATVKGSAAKSSRWFSDYDAADSVLSERHARMLLSDLVAISQGGSPFNLAADFYDTVSDVFQKTGQSMIAASAILRDEYMFKVLCHSYGYVVLYCDIRSMIMLYVGVAQRLHFD